MAASINASTSAGVVTTADTSGNLNLQSGGTTIVALTSAGAAVTGTLSASGAATLSSTLGVTGATTLSSTLAAGNTTITGTLSASGKVTATTAGIDVPTSNLGMVNSGTYTPSLTNGTNMAASTAYPLQYLRVGNTVVVGGFVGIDATSAGSDTSMRMSLPISSNFTTSTDAGGSGSAPCTGSTANDGWVFYSNSATDDIQIDGRAMEAAARNLFFTFVYQIK